MKAKVGTTIKDNSYEAGVEIINSSSIGIKNPKIGFLFSSVKYNQKELLEGIKSINPTLNIIGMTSSDAIMTQEGIITGENGFAGLMLVEDNELKVITSSSKREGTARETGRKVAAKALEKSGKKFSPSSFVMFATPSEENEYLKGVQDILGDIPVFGGTACDDNIIGDWEVISDEGSFKSGCAIALLYTNKKIKSIYETGYQETNNYGIITKVEEDSIISEIDHVPALKKYSEWTGMDTKELLGPNLMTKSIQYPLGIKNIEENTITIKHPIIANQDNSMILDSNITDKICIVQMKSNIDNMINHTSKCIKKIYNDFEPTACIIIQNCFREKILNDDIDENFVAIKNTIGNIPFIVAFSFKEYGRIEHSNLINSLAISVTGFSK